MKKYLLGIDVGTYSSKAALTDLQGQVVQTAVTPHGISLPHPGHVEQDADAVWWADVCTLSQRILQQARVQPSEVAALGVSAIGPCLLPLDAQMRPLRPGILYGVDVRAGAEINELEQRLGAAAVAGHSLMEFTSQAIGPKIRWLQKHEPALWDATRFVTTATSYLVLRLTGEHVMDRHSASHYMPLYDPRQGRWDDALGSELIEPAYLPDLGWCDDLAGTLSAEAAAATGLAEGTPVAVGAVDALSEALSVGVREPGDLMVMYGSTTFFILVQQQPTPDARVWTVAGAYPGQFNLAAGMSTTGSLTRWFKDELARELNPDQGYAQLFDAAAAEAPGAGGLLVLPYFSGERTPINDTEASGVIAGLSLSHRREQLFRAVLEGVGYGVRHNLETFATIGAEVKRVVAVGGGAQTDTWLQIVSDISGCVQTVPSATIGASYGDAFLAGCAAGLLQRSDLANWVKPDRTIRPRAQHKPLYDEMYAQYLKLYQGSREVMHSLRRIAARQPAP